MRGLFLLVLWLGALLVYFADDGMGFTIYFGPLGAALACLVYLLNPLPLLHYHSRRWLLKLIVSVDWMFICLVPNL